MKLISSNKVETNRYELVIEIDGETFMKAVNAVYKKQVKNITIPGFRKGKAPRSIIEREYGEGVFYEDALKELYPQAIEDAADEGDTDEDKEAKEKDAKLAAKDGDIEKLKKALETAADKIEDEKLLSKINALLTAIDSGAANNETDVGAIKESIAILSL